MPTKSRTAPLAAFSDGSCSETFHRDQWRGCGNCPGSRVRAHTFWLPRHVPKVAQTWQMQTGKLTVLRRQNYLHTFLLWHPCRHCLHLQPKQLLKEPDLGMHRQIPLTFSTENAQIQLGDYLQYTHYSSKLIWSNLRLSVMIKATLLKVHECILINLNESNQTSSSFKSSKNHIHWQDECDLVNEPTQAIWYIQYR